MMYGIVMTPETASASRPDLNLDSLRVYFLYEDYIGRPVMLSEYEDYTPDGETPDGTYFKTWGNSYPIFHATYDPFGSINEDFDSTGIVVGNNNDTKITWAVPFRFPGQYQDPELEGVIFYNWNRYYSPAIGRYNRADPLRDILLHKQKGKLFSTKEIIEFSQMMESPRWILNGNSNRFPPNMTIGKFTGSFESYNYAYNSPIINIDYKGLITKCDIYCSAFLDIAGSALMATGVSLATAPIVPVAQTAGGALVSFGALTFGVGFLGGCGPLFCDGFCKAYPCSALCDEKESWWKIWKPYEKNKKCKDECIQAN